MTSKWRPRHVRTRLTLWYVGMLAATLVLYAAIALLFLRYTLREELDQNLDADLQIAEASLRRGGDGLASSEGRDDLRDRGAVVEAWSNGKLLYRSPGFTADSLGGPSEARELDSVTLKNGVRVRVRTATRLIAPHGDVTIRVARSEERLHHEWWELFGGLAIGWPLALAIAGGGGLWLARRALAPLDRMARQAERITADNLAERLPVENPDDELGHLARVINVSLQRIEEAFGQLRRFTADASHELRTPLTAIRAVGEVALQDQRDAERYREAIGSMLEEVDRLSRLVDSLLVLSRADAGSALRRQPVDLDRIARDSGELLGILAEERGQRLEVCGEPGLSVSADSVVLRQAVIALIDNAIKHSPRGTPIRVEVGRASPTEASLAVTDQGPGIPDAHRSRVFERFYRVDQARTRENGGAGLGLSIADWAVRAHGGRIELKTAEGKGSTFQIILPLAEAARNLTNLSGNLQ